MTRDPVVQFAIMLVAAVEPVPSSQVDSRRPRRRWRDPPKKFTFKAFCDWIRHELEEELRRKWKIKANGVGVSASQATAVVSDSFRQTPPGLGCYRLFRAVNWNGPDQLHASSRE